MPEKSKEIMERARERYKVAKEAWTPVFQKAMEDLRFLSDEPFAQWDQDEAFSDRRKLKLPIVQIDQLSQFVHQVVNDVRMNTPTIKVIPVGSGADQETAEFLSGRIKAIEYRSNADSAYDLALDFAVKSSIGFIRVDHEYINKAKNEQQLCISRVVNPAAIYLDPDDTSCDGSESKYAFIRDEMDEVVFKKKYPGYSPTSWEDSDSNVPNSESRKKIIIVEYYEKGEEQVEEGEGEGVSREKVMRYLLSGDDVLESTSFPGKYIPIVPVCGEEYWMGGVRGLYSLIRKSKSAQKMYNLWKSLETDLLMKQPQAPIMAAVGQLSGYEEDYKNADKAAALLYHQLDINGNPAPPPQRLAPPMVPTGIVNAARETVDDIKATLGMYNASIGARSNETSGKAINARKLEGDVATYHYGDNLVRSITQVGKILVSALPEVEDTARVVQTLDQEDNAKSVGINGALVEGQERTYYTNTGDFDVRVITGAPFTTQRQEAAALYADIIKSMPDMMPIIGDLVFKYQDAPGSQAAAERIKKTIDPKLLGEGERDEKAVDPQILQLQAQLQQTTEQAQQVVLEAQQQITALQQEVKNKENDYNVKLAEIQLKDKELEIKAAEVGVKAQQAKKVDLDPLEQDLKEREMRLKEAHFEMELLAKQTEYRLKMLEASRVNLHESMEGERENLEQESQDESQMAALEAQQAHTAILAEGMAAIQQMLERLNQNMERPISIVRDAEGNVMGAA